MVLRRFMVVALAVSLCAGCRVPPTPEQIARCRSDSRVELPAAPKARSLRLAGDSWTFRSCRSCEALLRDRNLEFVEIFPSNGIDDGVDRVRLHPLGSAACTPRPAVDRWLMPSAHRLRTPRGFCLGIEPNVAPIADVTIGVDTVPTTDHPATVTSAVRGDTVIARIVDFRAEFADAAGSSCATILKGGSFPPRAVDRIIDHVTERRAAR